jgi:hypothetical protein
MMYHRSMFVERNDLAAGYLVQRFGAVTLAMSTRLHVFGEIDDAELAPAQEIAPRGPRRNLPALPARKIILASSEAEAEAPFG